MQQQPTAVHNIETEEIGRVCDALFIDILIFE